MSIKVQGTRRVITALTKGVEQYVNRTQNATMKAALKAEALVKKNTPVDTGNLRSSVNAQLAGKKRDRVEAVVGTNVEYAPYLEFGTRRMAPRAMFRKVIDQNGKEIWQTFRSHMK